MHTELLTTAPPVDEIAGELNAANWKPTARNIKDSAVPETKKSTFQIIPFNAETTFV